MHGQTFQVGSVSGDIFLNIFFLSGGKNDSLKILKFLQNWHFLNKNFEKKKKKKKKIFSYFQKFLAKFSLTLTKNGWFNIVWAN